MWTIWKQGSLRQGERSLYSRPTCPRLLDYQSRYWDLLAVRTTHPLG